MDLLQSVRIHIMPRYLRTVLIFISIVIVSLDIFVLFNGFSDKRNDYWIAAGTSLLAVVLPLLLIGVIFVFSHSGHRALKDRTALILLRHIPAELLRISEDSAREYRAYQPERWFNWFSSPNRPFPERSLVQLEYSYERNDCAADYRIGVPANLYSGDPVLLRLRVEINVHKLNLVIWVDEKQKMLAETITRHASSSRFSDAEQQAIPMLNTLIGATKSGYTVNKELINRHHDSGIHYGIVFIRELAPDFLWNPAEQMFIAQDLMFMVRALMVEGGGTFSAA